MSLELPEILLKLAAAANDGVDALLRATSAVLGQAAPFDAAEIAVSRPLGFERWTLTEAEAPIAGDDVLFHVIARREALRLDDLHEVAPYPRTLERMKALGLRSLLILPLNAAGGCEGAIVVARDFGWAFVGSSLRTLWGVAGITGLCLEKAIGGAAATRDADVQHRRADDAQHALQAMSEKVQQLERELAATRARLAAHENQTLRLPAVSAGADAGETLVQPSAPAGTQPLLPASESSKRSRRHGRQRGPLSQ